MDKTFENSWKEGSTQYYGRKGFTLLEKKGKRHVLSTYVLKCEEILLDMGFDQVFLKPIWEEKHIRMQYGPEAPAILDRLYYLASLPRPDIAVSAEKQERIAARVKISMETLKQIFRDYKLGGIDSGELIETFVQKLKITTEDALYVLSLFPELETIEPESTTRTLISHFTTAWFPTLASMKKDPPVLLFTSGWRFRREQREGPRHLRAHYNLSFVIMGNLGIEDGMDIVKEFFSRLEMDVNFVLKDNQPSYYAYNTNYEVFHRNMEVADIGMFSPVALKNYKIAYPVFNAGPGLGRIAMLKEGLTDLRQVHFPELYGRQYTDEDILESVDVVKRAQNNELVELIVNTARKYKDEKSPCRFIVYEDVKVKIELVEEEENTSLIGPAGFNEICVYKGSIYGIPPLSDNEKFRPIIEKGVTNHLTYMEAFAHFVVSNLSKGTYRVGMVKSLSDINVDIPEEVRDFIRSQGRIDVRGPMFTTIVVS